MEITIAEIKKVAKTLPIGYYTKRPIPVTLDDKSETSYYTPLTDEICISTKQISQSMKKVPEKADREVMIRSNLYHEVSHAILTPQSLDINDVINIFEDERIETLLANFYLDVDFEADKYYINGLEIGEVPPASNALGAFYNLVRFHSGPPALLDEVDCLIQRYCYLNRQSAYYESYNYYKEVMELYSKLCKALSKSSKKKTSNQKSGGSKGKAGSSKGQMAVPGSEEGETRTSRHGLGKNIAEDCAEKAFDSVGKPSINAEIYNGFLTILNNFRKKNSGGSALRSYSGILNPRSIAKEDYKIFDRPATVRGGNSYGSLHLNLFIDKSGSFYDSQNIVNELLRTLTQIEAQANNFTMDVVFCGNGQKKIEAVKDRILSCGGGNNLTPDILPLFRSLQKTQTYNYNIVLFDGDAYSNQMCFPSGEEFRAFDTLNTTIISDKENFRYINKQVKTAKVIYTKKYTEELIRNIQQTLERAFR